MYHVTFQYSLDFVDAYVCFLLYGSTERTCLAWQYKLPGTEENILQYSEKGNVNKIRRIFSKIVIYQKM